MPSFLAVRNPFNERDAEGIIENQLGRLEVNAVLHPVGFVLCLIPFDPHLYLHYSKYGEESQRTVTEDELRQDPVLRRFRAFVAESFEITGFCVRFFPVFPASTSSFGTDTTAFAYSGAS